MASVAFADLLARFRRQSGNKSVKMSGMTGEFEIVNNKNAKAAVWKHFGFVKLKGSHEVDRKKVACRVCLTTLKFSGNTTNLIDHVRLKHGHLVNSCSVHAPAAATSSAHSSVVATVGQVSVDAAVQPTTSRQPIITAGVFGKLPPTSARAKAIASGIVRFLVKDLRPFNAVNGEGFHYLMQVLEPRYVVPSRQYFSETAIPLLYDTVKRAVIDEMKKASSVALTTDGWTSRATESYITITSSHVNDQWQIQSFVLQVKC